MKTGSSKMVPKTLLWTGTLALALMLPFQAAVFAQPGGTVTPTGTGKTRTGTTKGSSGRDAGTRDAGSSDGKSSSRAPDTSRGG